MLFTQNLSITLSRRRIWKRQSKSITRETGVRVTAMGEETPLLLTLNREQRFLPALKGQVSALSIR